MEAIDITIPAHWAICIEYGETDGLEDEDITAIEAWMADHPDLIYIDVPAAADDHQYFRQTHEGTRYGVLACDCLDVVAHFRHG